MNEVAGRVGWVLVAVLNCWTMGALAEPLTLKERYEKAAEFLPWRVDRYVHGMSLQPHWSPDGRSFWFAEDSRDGDRYWRVQLDGLRKTPLSSRPVDAIAASTALPAQGRDWLPSPNGKWAVRLDGNQLIRVDLRSNEHKALTTDGVPDYRYGSMRAAPTLSNQLNGDPDRPQGVWSPEGDRFLTYRVDERALTKLPVMVATLPRAEHQLPSVHFQNTAFRYSPRMQRAELIVFDMRDGNRIDLQVPKPYVASNSGMRWSTDGTTMFVGLSNSDGLTSTAYAVDTRTGNSRPLVTDSLASEINLNERFSYWHNGEQVVVYSLRSDWGHLYLHDGATGALIRPLTRGEWAVSSVLRIDENDRWIYFMAKGREPGHHPQHAHLYRVSLDGGEPVLLTPEDAQHDVKFSPDGRWFIDTYSTVISPPVTALRSVDGKSTLVLMQADIAELEALGWKPPIPFTVKSADGKSDHYGVLYLPHDLDTAQSYPLIESGYFDGNFVQWQFLTTLPWHGSALAMAQLGFAVVEFEGREALFRSRKTYLKFEDPKATEASFYDDRILAMRHLAQQYPFIDISRVGVYGHSNGGWRAARALLQHPEFYKVGVAAAGSHDYGTWRATAPPKAGQKEFEFPTNMTIAGNLQGKLLLMHGLIDDNVHVAQSLQLAQALIDAGKRFDMLILPEKNHNNLWRSGYANLRTWDYFVENLLQQQAPADVRLPDPPPAAPLN
ncbi:MAG TPA: DPP IV N-terminal domain-containing protein [Steroidobacter sp.]